MITETDKELAESVERAALAFNQAVEKAVNAGLEVETRDMTQSTIKGDLAYIGVKIFKVIEVI